MKKWLVSDFGVIVALIAAYLLLHLARLTILPVFADEAIYIRWSQLMIDDWWRYFMFPLNDGKTPLQMWLMVPLQFVFGDQLFAGRFLSVIAGLFQMLLNGYIVKELGGKKQTVWLAMLLTMVLPFWYFHHRMALIDALLALWLTVAVLAVIKIGQAVTEFSTTKTLFTRQSLLWTVVGALGFGLALLTKVPAILFVPCLALFVFLPPKLTLARRFHLLLYIGASIVGGLALFALLRLHPVFPQLFARGSDFLFPWQEVILEGKWRETLPSWTTYVSYFIYYLTLPVVAFCVFGLFGIKNSRRNHILFWAGVGFIFPIALLGRVVFARYLFPASIFFTLLAPLVVQDLLTRWHTPGKISMKSTVLSGIVFLMVANALATSAVYITQSLTNPNNTPFVASDRVQYLTEWSSGHGVKEAVRFFQDEAQSSRVLVGTEGFFGTLPDGALMYLHRQDTTNITLEGIGQPITGLPENFATKMSDYDKTYLLVNSHRMQMKLPQDKLVHQFCRPFNAPCLQIWDVSALRP